MQPVYVIWSESHGDYVSADAGQPLPPLEPVAPIVVPFSLTDRTTWPAKMRAAAHRISPERCPYCGQRARDARAHRCDGGRAEADRSTARYLRD